MERTIKVTGKGKLSVKPDTIRIIITQSKVEKTYEGVIRESADDKENLTESLVKLGFAKEDLKTLFFNTQTEYEDYETKNGNWRRRLKGYRYTHRMKLEFPVNNEKLGKVLGTVAKCIGEPEFTIQYTIADPEGAKNELLAKAIEDSKTKAAVLSKAAGVELKAILNIDYSWGEIDFVTRPVNSLMLKECRMIEADGEDNGINLDIEADDIDVTDIVTVVWEIG